jgi:hypothetical protein
VGKRGVLRGLTLPKAHFGDAVRDDVLLKQKKHLKAERAAKRSAQLVDRRVRDLILGL